MASIKDLTPQDIGEIKYLLASGELQHRIAAKFDINAGRISEIHTGKRFAHILPAHSAAPATEH
ncbi:hypothetical protein [Devosia faecipullorum]|uniref:hypothetical protein n=1 Tax=Devosia faecipullorum TaxID=2755039 RepID=UPI00187B75DF|nr:hypothetical protein [Devosia faecipullorum]MBE7734553.1 hypothetical protein [Devosia faecipullorum]